MTVERTFCYTCTRHMPTAGGKPVRDSRGRLRFRCACCAASRAAHRRSATSQSHATGAPHLAAL
jgi:hypothetical protein